jgi:WD40 repeat protein
MIPLTVALLVASAPPEFVGPPAPRRDILGERLPDGAIARYGDHRMRGGTTEAVGFSADGKLLIRTRNGAIDLTDLTTGKDVTPAYLAGYRNARLYVLHDGRHLLHDTGRSNLCWLADPRTGEKTHDLDLDKQTAYSVTLTPDGKGALVWWNCSSGCGATAFDFAADKPRHRHFQMAVWSAYALSPDRRRVYALATNTLDVYDAATGEKLDSKVTTVGQHGRPLVSADGKTLVVQVGGKLHTADITSKGVGELTPLAGNHSNFDIGATVGTPDGSRLMVPVSGDSIDLKSGEQKSPKLEHTRVRAVSCYFSPDGKLACDLLANRGCVVWDTATGKTVRQFTALTELRGAVVSGDRTVTTVDNDLVVRVYDLPSGKLLHERAKRTVADGSRWGVVADDSGRMIEVESASAGRCSLVDAATGEAIRVLDTQSTGFVSYAHMRPDLDRALLTVGGKAALVELSTGTFVRHLPDTYYAAALSPNGRLIAAASPFTNQLLVIETVTNKVRRKFPVAAGAAAQVYAEGRRGPQPQPQNVNQVGTVRFTPDGDTVALFANDGRVAVWSIPENLLLHLDAGTGGRKTGAISPDGRWLAVADGNSLVLRDLREARHGAGTVPVRDVRSPVRSAVFTSDGTRLVTAHADGLSLLWDVGELVTAARVTAAPDPDDRMWETLADPDPAKAAKAVDDLSRDPAAAVRVLGPRVQPVRKPDADTLRKLIDELKDPDYRTREAAQKRLSEIRDLAADELAAVAKESSSAEQLERVNQLLVRMRAAETAPTRVRLFRAVEILERAGTADARRVLVTLSSGASESAISREAKLAVTRIDAAPRR